MTIEITHSKNIQLERELLEDLESSKAEEQRFLEIVEDPKAVERPYRSLSEIRESIEIIGRKSEAAKALADAERAKLPSADEARKIIKDTRAAEKEARKQFYEALTNAKNALDALHRAHEAHQASIGEGVSKLIKAGVPRTGAELDGEPLALTGDRLRHGDISLGSLTPPLEVEWSIPAKRYLQGNNKQSTTSGEAT